MDRNINILSCHAKDPHREVNSMAAWDGKKEEVPGTIGEADQAVAWPKR
jgi:hypothetical protein